MTSLQDLIKLAEVDSGKFFVMDEQGNIKLVMMTVADYEKALLGRATQGVTQNGVDSEQVNKEITKAQLHGETTPVDLPIGSNIAGSEVVKPPRVDMRAEVIDPSFNFDAPAATDEFEV